MNTIKTHADRVREISRGRAKARSCKIANLWAQANTYDQRGDTVLREQTYRSLRDLGVSAPKNANALQSSGRTRANPFWSMPND